MREIVRFCSRDLRVGRAPIRERILMNASRARDGRGRPPERGISTRLVFIR